MNLFKVVFCLLTLGAVAVAQVTAPDGVEKQSSWPVPVVTGAISFDTSFTPGSQSLNPNFSPILLIPMGSRFLVEGEFETDLVADRSQDAFGPLQLDKGIEYLQLDFLANNYLTIVSGRFATPFGLYKERFDARWIRNLSTTPLLFGLNDNSGTGVMLRGDIPINRELQLNYESYFSANTTWKIADSERQAGTRLSLFLPSPRLELGFSFNRRLAEQRFNMYGADLTWNVRAIPLDLRAEWLRSTGRGGGYWIEGAYRLRSLSRSAFLRRSQIVLRGEQFFSSADADTAASISDLYGVPLTDTQRLMWGWNYSLREGWRISASYGRQLSASGNAPLWTAGVSYHFGI